jgi:2-phospho-L-lactate/phosphoenolpyruvate guanylyltransferase
MRTAAILPVKRFAEAKQRLGESVADPLRRELAGAMVGDVIAALARTGAIERTIIVSNEPTIAETAREHGAVLIADRAERGQSAAVSLGIAHALAAGIERVLCVPGDCPALDPAELEALLGSDLGGAASATEVVIMPDRHGAGTNGLLLSPPRAIAPSFGPGSCERHRQLAIAADVPQRVERLASLLLDVDTGDDLAVLRERLAAAGAAAPRTRAVLGGANPPAILPIAHAG